MSWDVAFILGIDGLANGAVYLLAQDEKLKAGDQGYDRQHISPGRQQHCKKIRENFHSGTLVIEKPSNHSP